MAQVSKVLRMDNRGKDATVYIEIEGGHEVYEIYIGGAAEVWHDAAHNKLKAHIRRAQSRGKLDKLNHIK